MTFLQKLEASIGKNNSLLCIGLDPSLNKIPEHLKQEEFPLFVFNRAIIDRTYDFVCCYKLQIAHYSALGIPGIQQLMQTLHHLQSDYPRIPIILDAKRADIGSTASEYAKEAFDVFGVDAVTVNPYFGLDSLVPFLERAEKGIIILCRTSNPSAKDFQDLKIDGKPLYVKVAEKVIEWNKKYKNCLMVIGATYPDELKVIRELTPDMFFLIPGIGAQGGDIEKTLQNGLRKDKSGLIIHSSRAIIYASAGEDFAEAARKEAQKLRDVINSYRN